MARNAPICLLLLSCAGCSSIIEGTSQEILVNTFPAGASCTLLRNGQSIATVSPTPGTALVRKTKYEINVVCSKPGYAQAATVDHSGAAASIAGDILLPGVGWAIDSASGADNKYQSPINLTLDQAAPTATPANDAGMAPPVPTAQIFPPAPQNAGYYAIALPPGVTPQMLYQPAPPAPVAAPQNQQMIYYAISAPPPPAQATTPQPQMTFIPMRPSAYVPQSAPLSAPPAAAAPATQPQALLPPPASQELAANLPEMRLVRAYPPGTIPPQPALQAVPAAPVTVAALPSR